MLPKNYTFVWGECFFYRMNRRARCDIVKPAPSAFDWSPSPRDLDPQSLPPADAGRSGHAHIIARLIIAVSSATQILSFLLTA
jgi:hypothetical protein